MPNPLANIFGKSPVMPIENHMSMMLKAAELLPDFFAAVRSGNWDKAKDLRADLAQIEHEADTLKKKIRVGMPRSLLMPVARDDLLSLIQAQDSIAAVAKDISEIVMIRNLTLPDAIAADYDLYLSRNVDAVRLATTSVRELDELFTVGFRGSEAKLVETMLDKLDAIKTDVEGWDFQLQGSLYSLESSLDPIDAVFTYKLISRTGEIAACADRVGHRLELLLAH